MDAPLVIFVHIPRTAGTSCWEALLQAFPPLAIRGRQWPQVLICAHGHRMQEPASPQGYGLTGSWLEDYVARVQANPYVRCVGGHLPYGLHTAFPGEPCQYMTLLRNPIERVVSLYSMLRARPVVYNDTEHAIGEPVTHYWAEQYELNLLGMLEAGEFRLCNDQTRMITGGSEDSQLAQDLLASEYLYGTVEQIESFQHELSTHLQVSVSAVYTSLSFGHRNQYGAKQRRHMPVVERYTLSAREEEAVRAANAADIAVYEWAQAQVRQYG